MNGAYQFVRRPNAWKRRLFSPWIAFQPSPLEGEGSKKIHFTFDDGPDAVETPQVLDCLEHHGLTATFFLLGKAIAGNEPLIQRIHRNGHTLGNHTFSHPRFSPWHFRQPAVEIAECQRSIRSGCGILPEVARPPFGRCTPGFLLAAKRLGLRVQLWSLDSGDWKCRTATDAERCAEELKREMKAGDTILFHDNHPWIVPILQQILPSLSRLTLESRLGAVLCGAKKP